MSILESSILKKLPEWLLAKGDENRVLGKKLGRMTAIVRFHGNKAKLKCLLDLVDYVESNQMVIGGRTREDYKEALKSVPPEPFKNGDMK